MGYDIKQRRRAQNEGKRWKSDLKKYGNTYQRMAGALLMSGLTASVIQLAKHKLTSG
jgi:hypothetical protein